MEVVRHVQNTQNKKLVIFLHYLKKKVLQLLLCSIAMIFCGGSVIFVVACYLGIYDLFLTPGIKGLNARRYLSLVVSTQSF